MSQKEAVRRWIDSADDDWETAEALYKSKKFAYCLFFSHLALEKSFKALFISQKDTVPPITHDVLLLAKKTGHPLNERSIADFSEITTFNVEARYDVYKTELHKKATRAFTKMYMDKISLIRLWIKKQL
ncbi:TPA: DNA-binding protein [Patescibacteria group bacterium]|nr:DNA-binding protein [Patescibacteria group bacterium]